MNISFHGTGSGEPSAERGASCLTVEYLPGRLLLIDTGENASRAMLRDDIELQAVDVGVISHTHADHWAGLPNLVMAWSIAGRSDPVTLYIPPGSYDFFRNILTGSYLLESRLPYELRLIELSASGTSFDLSDSLRMSAGPTHHLDRYREEAATLGIPFPSFSFRIDDGDSKEGSGGILFSQDIQDIGDLVPYIRRGDVLICEATHVDCHRVLDMAHDFNLPHVYFTHVPPGFDAIESDGKKGDTNWTVVTDGSVISL